MQVEAVGSPTGETQPRHCARSRGRFRRRLANVLLGISLLVLALDALVCYWQGSDIVVQTLARLLLIGVAFLVSRSARDDLSWLLVWGLIGTSFDTFWSYRGGYDAHPREALMVLKYLAVPVGLAALIRFTAEFGGGDCDIAGVRKAIRTAAWPLGGVLALAGLVHGITYLAGCQYGPTYVAEAKTDLNDFYGCRSFVDFWFKAYLSVDVFARFVIIGAALVGLWVSTRKQREFSVLTLSCVVFAVGPALDFIARFYENSPIVGWVAGDTGRMINAASTVLFPIGLLAALHRRELENGSFLHKTAIVTIVLTALGGVWYGLEHLVEKVLDFSYTEFAHGVTDGQPHAPKWMIDIGLGVLVALLYKPASQFIGDYVERTMYPDRGKRLPILQHCVDQLQRITERRALDELLMRTSLDCGTHPLWLFKAEENGRFVCLVPQDDAFDVQVSLDNRCVAHLAEGKIAKSGVEKLFPGAVLAAPIVLRGKLIGVLACGAPRLYDPPEFEAAEERELFSLAREAGAALYAMGELRV